MASKTSLDEKLSDVVGSIDYEINDVFDLNYNFALDQNYKEFNFNEVGASINLSPIKIDLGYLQENQHIGDQEYFKTKLFLENKDQGLLSLKLKET